MSAQVGVMVAAEFGTELTIKDCERDFQRNALAVSFRVRQEVLAQVLEAQRTGAA